MNNRGQTTILFSLIISVLMFFTFSALEVGRIYMSRVKTAAVVQSARLSIMADYNRELFERYHLLFMDPTYGTGSEAVLEEKIKDYMEYSLNEESGKIYEFTIEEIAVTEKKNILDDDMRLLKKQIESYEKTAGIFHRAKEVSEKLQKQKTDVESAAKETERNGVELPQTTTNQSEEGEGNGGAVKGDETDSQIGNETQVEVTDPRDTLKESLQFGILSFLLPKDISISNTKMDLTDVPSCQYEAEQDKEKDNSFQDIGVLKEFLNKTAADEDSSGLVQKAAFLDYVDYHFSNGVNQKKDSVQKCEVEYILKGKDNDFDNMQSVVNEIIWLRMPVNYAYLLTDTEKKSEALTLAAAICTATGTEAFIEVVKYLLLGCWAYGETLCDMRTLLENKKIPYTKTAGTWKTDLKNLAVQTVSDRAEDGMSYRDYLLILLAKKNGKKQDISYARMLDMIERNLKKTDESFAFKNCVGKIGIQGKIHVNPLFVAGKEREIYEYYFDEQIAY